MNKAVVLVGAAGGVGLQTARKLTGSGYRVIGTVLDATQEAELRAQVPEIADVLHLDLSDADAVAATLKPLLETVELAGAVVCAAVAPHGPLEFASLASLRNVLEINTVSCVAVFQACMPALRKSKGRLILVSSHGGRVGFTFIGQYSGSKFALEGLGDVMRREAAPFQVPVILIQPGGLKTGMTMGQLAKIDRDIANLQSQERTLYGDLYAGFRGIIQGALALGTEPDVVAAAIVDALETPTPQSRYQVGQDAIDLVAMSKSATDEEIDAVFANMFKQAIAAQP
jgi:NAD(P)-dependent dehydrogenase (short-subunit alcohol dehydrogenase family)